MTAKLLRSESWAKIANDRNWGDYLKLQKGLAGVRVITQYSWRGLA